MTDLAQWDTTLTIRENAEALGITYDSAARLALKHQLGCFNGHKRRKPVAPVHTPKPGTLAERILDDYLNNRSLEGYHIGYVRSVIYRYGMDIPKVATG